MVEDLRSISTSFAINEKFLKLLPQRGDKAYRTLISALRYGSGQLHLIDMLEDTAIQIEGNIPLAIFSKVRLMME